MSYEEDALACQECGITFNADDQAYHALKGLTIQPKRCYSCRQARRSARMGARAGLVEKNGKTWRGGNRPLCLRAASQLLVINKIGE